MPLDPLASLRARLEKVEKLLRSRYLERSSITDGVMTFIRGRLRLLGGAVLEIVGNVIGSGTFDWTGQVFLKGPWNFSGKGTISGDVDASGDWAQTGDFEVLGGGRIKVGNVIITPGSGGRVTVGTGSAQVVLNGNDGTITSGENIKITPAGGGRIEVGGTDPLVLSVSTEGIARVMLPSGATIQTLSDDNIQAAIIAPGGARAVTIGTDNIVIRNGSKRVVVSEEGYTFFGLQTLPGGTSASYVVADNQGNIYKSAGVGGGGEGIPGPVAGDFMWPFPPSSTDPVLGVFGMRLNPVTGVWAMHWGRDFSVPGGSAIPAIGDGTVIAVSSGDARGNRIMIDHGNGVLSDYFHMQAPASLTVGATVSRGDIIGYVGTTGSSTGNHLHLEITQGGGRVDPAAFFAAQG